MLMEEARHALVEYGKKMSSAGLCRGTSGNLSVCDRKAGTMAITPSGIGYFETKEDDIVIMDLDGHVIEGDRKPSSEYGMHSRFYKAKPDICGIVHTHSVYCTTLACMRVPIEPIHFCSVGARAYRIPCAPYATFGTPELAEAAVKACGDSRAVLLANHGMIACGTSLKDAFDLAENVEFAAELQWRCMCAGKAVPMTKAEYDAAVRRFGSYGQKKDPDRTH